VFYSKQLVLPEWVYHGTTSDAVAGFVKNGLIDTRYWKPKRDFGAGFYTTIDLEQAKEWAEKMARRFGEEPIVLQIRCATTVTREEASHLVFVGAGNEWAEYILDHRTIDQTESDPCEAKGGQHLDLIIGPLADNDTGHVIKMFQESGDKNIQWFKEQITRNQDGQALQGFALGNQVVFCNPDVANELLKLDGIWEVNSNGEWVAV
jgi:Protein of unknown function (DUF3990)